MITLTVMSHLSAFLLSTICLFCVLPYLDFTKIWNTDQLSKRKKVLKLMILLRGFDTNTSLKIPSIKHIYGYVKYTFFGMIL